MILKNRGILVHPEDLTCDWIDRMCAAGLNVLGIHPVGGKLAHESLQQAVERHAGQDFSGMLKYAKNKGLTLEYEAHALAWLLPRSMFAEHPDWFRMDAGGARNPDFNLCVSNRDALDYIARRTAELAGLLETGSDRYYFWLDDVTGRSCSCPECRRLSPSDQQMIAVNAMLRGLRTYNPKAQLCYIAYHDALEAPRKVDPENGVFLEYAPIRRNMHRPINDPDCAENVRETRYLPDLISCFGAANARILEYWMDNSLFSNWKRPPKPFTLDAEVMKRDVEYYASLGFRDITSFGCFLGPDYDELYGKTDLNIYGDILNEKRG